MALLLQISHEKIVFSCRLFHVTARFSLSPIEDSINFSHEIYAETTEEILVILLVFKQSQDFMVTFIVIVA